MNHVKESRFTHSRQLAKDATEREIFEAKDWLKNAFPYLERIDELTAWGVIYFVELYYAGGWEWFKKSI